MISGEEYIRKNSLRNTLKLFFSKLPAWTDKEIFLSHNKWYFKPIVISPTVNILYFTILYLLTSTRLFNDDIGIMLFSKGFSNIEPTSFIFLGNILLGSFLVSLQKLSVGINFYAFFLIFLNFLSLCTIFFVFLKSAPKRITVVLYFVFLFLLTPVAFQSLNYFITSCLLSIAAWSIFVYISENDIKKTFYLVMFIVFIALSAMLREEMFFLATIFFFPFLIYIVTRRKWFFLMIYAIAFAVIISVNLYNDYRYSREKGWSEFLTYVKDHEFLTRSHKFIKYEHAKEVCDRIGWSENDYNLLQYYFLFPSDVFSRDKLREAVSMIQGQKRSNDESLLGYKIKTFIKSVSDPLEIRPFLNFLFRGFFIQNISILIFCLSLLFLISRQNLFYVLVSVLIFFFLIFLLFFIYFPFYLQNTLWVFLSFILLIFIVVYRGFTSVDANKFRKGAMAIIILLIMPLLIVMSIISIRSNSLYSSKAHHFFNIVTSSVLQRSNSYLSFFSFSYDNFNPFSRQANQYLYSHPNIIPIGWYINSPLYYQLLKVNQINDPMEDLLKNDKVFLITPDNERFPEMIRIYYLEHNHINVKLNPIEKISDAPFNCVIYDIKPQEGSNR